MSLTIKSRMSAPDPLDGDRYHHVDKSPSRLLNSFGVIKAYPNKKYSDNLDRILENERKKRERESEEGT